MKLIIIPSNIEKKINNKIKFISIIYYFKVYKEKLAQLYLAINLVGLILFIQIILGILTLLYGAQIVLASMHQISSIILVSSSVYLLFLSANQQLSN